GRSEALGIAFSAGFFLVTLRGLPTLVLCCGGLFATTSTALGRANSFATQSLEIKRIKELALSTVSPPHHGPLPRIHRLNPMESRFAHRLNESFATQSLESGHALTPAASS